MGQEGEKSDCEINSPTGDWSGPFKYLWELIQVSSNWFIAPINFW